MQQYLFILFLLQFFFHLVLTVIKLDEKESWKWVNSGIALIEKCWLFGLSLSVFLPLPLISLSLSLSLSVETWHVCQVRKIRFGCPPSRSTLSAEFCYSIHWKLIVFGWIRTLIILSPRVNFVQLDGELIRARVAKCIDSNSKSAATTTTTTTTTTWKWKKKENSGQDKTSISIYKWKCACLKWNEYYNRHQIKINWQCIVEKLRKIFKK